MVNSGLRKFLPLEAASWLAFSVFVPVSVLGVPLTIANDSSTPGAFLQWVGIGFLATLAACIPLFMFHIFSRKTARGDLSFISVLVVISTAGALRGIVIAGLSEPSGLHDAVLPVVRIFNSTLTTTIWLAVAGLVIASRRTYVDDYQKLFAKAVSRRANQIVDSAGGEVLTTLEMTARELFSVGTKLRATIDSVSSEQSSERSLDQDALRAIARSIHEAVEKEIRPLSHRLWFKEPYLPPRVRIPRLIADAAMKLPFPVRQLSWVLVPGLFIGFPVRLGLRNGGILAVVSTVSIYGILFVANLFVHRTASRIAAVASLILLTVVPATLAVSLQRVLKSLHVNEANVVLSLVGLVALIVMLQMVLIARSDRELVLHELEQITLHPANGDDGEDGATGERARIASFLHNTVQSELTSVALQLENAAEEHDFATVRSTLVRAEQILNRSFVDDFNTFYASPVDRVSSLPLAWQGIAEVHIDTESFSHLPRTIQLVASQVIEEGIANAVRSGGATEVSVQLLHSSASAQIVVKDNGVLQESTEPGMGTSWLNSVSGSNWSRTGESGETTLRVVLEINESSS